MRCLGTTGESLSKESGFVVVVGNVAGRLVGRAVVRVAQVCRSMDSRIGGAWHAWNGTVMVGLGVAQL